MKTLHFIPLNCCFVSIRIVVRFTHDYRDFVADNEYAILIQIPVYSSVNACKRVPYVARAQEQVVACI